jgi:hypothetical protein
MSEVASFGNIVNSLLSLRQNYHEQLKTVPQYEAYLLVESSTTKASGALQASAESPASIAAEVIDSLQFARSRFEQHLNSIPEYRTLRAIDKLIREISADLGIFKPQQAHAFDVTEVGVTTPATELVSAASTAPEPDEVVATAAAEPEETEVSTEPPPVELPVQPSRAVTIAIDDALAGSDDDIVPLHVPRPEAAIGDGEQDDLEMTPRGVAQATAETAGLKDAAEPHPPAAPQSEMLDEDPDEVAA